MDQLFEVNNKEKFVWNMLCIWLIECLKLRLELVFHSEKATVKSSIYFVFEHRTP